MIVLILILTLGLCLGGVVLARSDEEQHAAQHRAVEPVEPVDGNARNGVCAPCVGVGEAVEWPGHVHGERPQELESLEQQPQQRQE